MYVHVCVIFVLVHAIVASSLHLILFILCSLVVVAVEKLILSAETHVKGGVSACSEDSE